MDLNFNSTNTITAAIAITYAVFVKWALDNFKDLISSQKFKESAKRKLTKNLFIVTGNLVLFGVCVWQFAKDMSENTPITRWVIVRITVDVAEVVLALLFLVGFLAFISGRRAALRDIEKRKSLELRP